MMERNFTELTTMLWPLDGAEEYISLDGRDINVTACGEYDSQRNRFTGAVVETGSQVHHGEVVIGSAEKLAAGSFQSVILHVTQGPCTPLMKNDGSPITQIVFTPDPLSAAAYDSLKQGSTSFDCGGHISRMEPHLRVSLFTRLLADRLERKCREIKQIHSECQQNWNQTLYVNLLRRMGDMKNKEPFTELARRVSYMALARERTNIQYVEAMLIGASGLLDAYEDDIYIRDLKRDFDYLRRKYSITPLSGGAWRISHNNPYNHPVLRLAQLAAFLSTREFLFDNMMRCRSAEDVRRFFRAEASQYWSTHYIPGKRSDNSPKRVGQTKAELLGINLVIPMMFAYGDCIADERLKERALELLEGLEPENNYITRGWNQQGVPMESAFDSQALIQLHNEHCDSEACWQCPVGKRVIRTVWENQHKSP